MPLRAVLIAGVNGAGKTTLARRLLRKVHRDLEYLNPDEIQLREPAFAHPVAAGRELLRRLAAKEHAREGFMIETTLSSTMYARRIRAWRERGFKVTLHFIEAPSVAFAIRRVARRVAHGGHDIPTTDIRRRYGRGLALFEHVYKPLVDEWYHWLARKDDVDLAAYEKR
jgi:predicted ABC-type ATPase